MTTQIDAVVIDTAEVTVPAEVDDGRLLVGPDALRRATGWELKPEGLCRGEVCVPVRDRDRLTVGGRVDLAAFAEALHRPLALEAAEGVAVLGEPSAAVGGDPAGRLADLDLLDDAGQPFRWSALGRKKKLLVAWASW